MLSNKERWMLVGTWSLIVLCGMGGVLLISDRGSVPPAAGPADRIGCPLPGTSGPDRVSRTLSHWQNVIEPIRVPVTPYIGAFVPAIQYVDKPVPPSVEFLLPPLHYSGRVEMDRATLTWSLKELKPGPYQNLSAPEAILIHRQCEGGEIERVATLDPKATSFEDRDVLPNRSYRYWVLVRGLEGVKSYKDSTVRPFDKEGEGSVVGVVPSWHKVRLVGGDREHAILGVDSYNPVKGRWEPRIVKASPGQEIGVTGWRLERLRFDRFTLVAEATDDRLEKRELSTKKE